MKIFRSLAQWASLYILIGIFLAVFFWEENLQTDPVTHQMLAIGLLIGFFFLVNIWIEHHQQNFLVSQLHETLDEDRSASHLPKNSEK